MTGSSVTVGIEEFVQGFAEEPGFLNFAWTGPTGEAVRNEEFAMSNLLGHGRFGTLSVLEEQHERVRNAISSLIGFRSDQVVFQPGTSQGLMHALFGIEGAIAISSAEFPSLPFAAVRAAEALGKLTPQWFEPDHGRITPGNLRDELTEETTAVGVSLVDFRTGYKLDLEGIRQVIGDRLLVLDAIQGFGVVDVPWHLADVIASGGQKWARAGGGTGFLALSDRAIERIAPVLSGFPGTDADGLPLDGVLPPNHSAQAFQISNTDPVAQARLATAAEDIARVGVSAIVSKLAQQVSRVIDLADEFGLAVVSPRDETERAGIVVIEPPVDQLTVLSASLHNHGVSATVRGGTVRLSPHVTTEDETFEMLRASFVSFTTAI